LGKDHCEDHEVNQQNEGPCAAMVTSGTTEAPPVAGGDGGDTTTVIYLSTVPTVSTTKTMEEVVHGSEVTG